MATKKKGCGFLITAIVLLIAAAGIFALGIFGAVKSFEPISSFNTPSSTTITADDNGAISVWLHGNDNSVPAGTSINVTDVASGQIVAAPTTTINSHMKVNGDRRILLGSFEATKGSNYKVQVANVPNGSKISLSNTSTAAAVGSIGMAIVGPMICGVLALIFGIIGLVKFIGSKKADPQAAAPPAA